MNHPESRIGRGQICVPAGINGFRELIKNKLAELGIAQDEDTWSAGRPVASVISNLRYQLPLSGRIRGW
ncbi:MAG: hypothetical protein FIB07_00170 [Candidatus Methanoperedens sp.]|nr:hypothetical protein [Candidatus Methanoperedens sp.]